MTVQSPLMPCSVALSRELPLSCKGEGKGLSHLGDLTGIEHVIVVGPFSSGTNAMCEYLPLEPDFRLRDAQRDPNLMDTSSGRDVVPWQFSDVPPRFIPGLLTYTEVIKKWIKIADFVPLYTRPRPFRCLIHPVEPCKQCHLCLESLSWSLEQTYAHRLGSIQF